MSWKKTDERLIKLGMHIFSGEGKFLDLRQLSGVIRNLFRVKPH